VGVKLGFSPWGGGEHILKMFKKRVLRKVFGPNREEAAGGWK